MIVQPCTILFSEQKGNIKNIIIMQPCSAQLLQLLLHTQLRLILIIMIMLNFAVALKLSVLVVAFFVNITIIVICVKNIILPRSPLLAEQRPSCSQFQTFALVPTDISRWPFF